ncbi:GntR family transcriptional regulator [Thermosipho melanesiensis]|uniref:Regulatory protein GntR, HTH n=2 Tax=Thermosipho melanesiensis TaxID=46541 RepID=A6LM37_THEM4|nr:GntR family transcriptional regulator [Thermosipho melanesiensis]ABR30988.1 regulatory protein GntR, HTH [Thermosipho melanesiensis BI429]APT74085.1 GntR family transcriptional regulator [Thermosipho melanesiensis]OOC36031.1 GntR family transcriptional regulator [Thermosipho melanesiensis]OOC36848.1 GntR family transcriptional regulator [Thermosipho melanesiensis]OOC37599.1 GntR family transcriptional regulator [Thermosipho melanesiensis]
MWFNINFSSHIPVYKQIVENIKIEILKGNIKKGEFLPSIRKLASDLGVNLNTVARAYRELVNEKIIEAIRGEGYIVIENSLKNFNNELLNDLSEIVKKCLKAGISIDDICNLIKGGEFSDNS